MVLLNPKLINTDPDRLILDLLRERPLSIDSLCLVTGMTRQSVKMKLYKLQKWGLVTPATRKQAFYWKARAIRREL